MAARGGSEQIGGRGGEKCLDSRYIFTNRDIRICQRVGKEI